MKMLSSSNLNNATRVKQPKPPISPHWISSFNSGNLLGMFAFDTVHSTPTSQLSIYLEWFLLPLAIALHNIRAVYLIVCYLTRFSSVIVLFFNCRLLLLAFSSLSVFSLPSLLTNYKHFTNMLAEHLIRLKALLLL